MPPTLQAWKNIRPKHLHVLFSCDIQLNVNSKVMNSAINTAVEWPAICADNSEHHAQELAFHVKTHFYETQKAAAIAAATK